MQKNGSLKEEFSNSAQKKETPAWAVKFVNDMRTGKADAHLGAALEKVALANIANDGSNFGKATAIKTAYEQIMKEVQKQMQEHPKDLNVLIKETGVLNQEYRALAVATVGPQDGKNPPKDAPRRTNRHPPQ
jgi:hypothetical protein